MSQIIASDAPLLSPVSADSFWEQHSPTSTTDSFAFNYYSLPPSPPNSVGSTSTDSPVPTSRMLKMRMSPEGSDSEQLCLPTHQVFDFPDLSNPLSPPSPSPSSPQQERLSISIKSSANPGPAKRSASPTPGVTKKPRSVGERISSKDFVPPDVSGLSKREARLVKNRAAAFLSRQRKREEFECMEVRVAELEQENARLLAMTQNGSTSHSRPDALLSEVEKLRAQLADAEARERELNAELAAKAAAERDPPIKIEAPEIPFLSSSAAARPNIQAPHRSSGASLGLMVLLCALPTLLSMPAHASAPTTFSIPTALPASSSSFDFNSFMPNEFDWSRSSNSNGMMDLDIDDQATSNSAPSVTRKLEFAGVDSSALGDLGGLDISFDASPSENGRIRVRIHPPSSASSRAQSPSSSSSYSYKVDESSGLDVWSTNPEPSFDAGFSSQSFGSSSPYHASAVGGGDPFLGIGASSNYGLGVHYPQASGPMSMYGQEAGDLSSIDFAQSPDSAFGFGSEYSIADPSCSGSGKRRVRIALKSMPTPGGEGGEWEVQIC